MIKDKDKLTVCNTLTKLKLVAKFLFGEYNMKTGVYIIFIEQRNKNN